MPKISVILPVYNGGRYLKDAIESVLAQTLQNFELIIIDDCSTDDSAEIAQRYAVIDSRVTYERNDVNLKLPKALNKGFDTARGEYWTWTSCDNLYMPEALEEMTKALDTHADIGLVYASMQMIDEFGRSQEVIDAGPSGHLIFRNVVGACFLYRRVIAEKIGEYNPNLFLCEDYDYWLRIACVSKIHSIKETLYLYRRHRDNLSHQHEEKVIAKGIAVQKQYYSRFIKTRKDAALFYASLRSRDIYNPLRQLYLLYVLCYSPRQFLNEICGLIKRRFRWQKK